MACENTVTCTCTYACPRHGKCCACVTYHNRAGELPGCFFSAPGEKTYDRSLGALVNDRKR